MSTWPDKKADRLGQAADRIDVDPLDDGGLGRVGRWDEQAGSLLGGRLQGHRQNSLDRPGFAGQGQFADDRQTCPAGRRQTWPLPTSNPKRDRQVEPAGIFLEVGGRQVDHHPINRPAISRVDDRTLDPVRTLPDGGLREADQHRLGLRRERDVDFDFNGRCVDSDEGVRSKLGEHIDSVHAGSHVGRGLGSVRPPQTSSD